MDGLSTMNSTCVEKYFDGFNVTALSTETDSSLLRVVQIMYAVGLFFFGVLLNTLVLAVIVKSPKLRTSFSFCIAFQLCLSNVVCVLFYSIPIIISHSAGQWILGQHFCTLCAFITFTATSLRNLLIFVFAVDRFALVYMPFFYPKRRSKFVLLLCAFSWALSTAYSIIAVPQLLDCYIFSRPLLSCFFSYRCSKSCLIFNIVFIFSNTFPTTVSSVFCFLVLFIKGRILNYRDNKLLGGKGAPNNLRNQRKAIRTFSCLLLALIVVVVPSFIIANIANSFSEGFQEVALKISLNAIFFLIITDSLIIIQNSDFKESFLKFIKVSKPISLETSSSSTIIMEENLKDI